MTHTIAIELSNSMPIIGWKQHHGADFWFNDELCCVSLGCVQRIGFAELNAAVVPIQLILIEFGNLCVIRATHPTFIVNMTAIVAAFFDDG